MAASALIREPHDSALCRASDPPLQTFRLRLDQAERTTDACNDRPMRTHRGLGHLEPKERTARD